MIEGSLLRATGTALRTGVPGACVATLLDDGTMFMMRSTNGPPLPVFEAGASAAGPHCIGLIMPQSAASQRPA